MPRSRLIFLAILAGAVVIVLAIRFVVPALPVAPTATPMPTLSIRVAVNPAGYEWAKEQAALFEARQEKLNGRPITLKIERQDGLLVWNGSAWSSANQPVLWIAEGKFAIDFAAGNSLRYTTERDTLASTVLLWGAFNDRADALATLNPNLDWEAVQSAAAKERWSASGGQVGWGFVKPAIADPAQSTMGMAALLTGAASYHKVGALTDAQLADSSFRAWLLPFVQGVPKLGVTPASTLATRGASVADFGLLPENEWALVGQQLATRMRFAYPAYRITFEMPAALANNATAEEKEAARKFINFLAATEAQNQLVKFGLRPFEAALTMTTAGRLSSLENAGLALVLPTATDVVFPSRQAIQGLLSWYRANSR
jgi:Bacterial extracellular solute-binding protein